MRIFRFLVVLAVLVITCGQAFAQFQGYRIAPFYQYRTYEDKGVEEFLWFDVYAVYDDVGELFETRDVMGPIALTNNATEEIPIGWNYTSSVEYWISGKYEGGQ